MEESRKRKAMTKQSTFILFVSLMTLIFFTSAAHAEWFFGIGTGLSLMNVDGEQGFNTELVGPVKYDVELNPKDFNDLTKSAFGFGGYATDGTWLIQYSYANLELEDKASEFLPAYNSTSTVKINFKISGAELTVGYPVYKTSSLVALVDAGVRYTKHEFDGKLRVSGDVTAQRDRDFDHDWTDAIVGVSINVPFAQKWTWNNRFNAGFGGSEGTYFVSTGLTWQFHKNWSTGIVAKYMAIEYENGSKGDRNWYLYDADESSIGLNVLFNW